MTAPDLSTRLPPHNRDAERGVLGGIFRDPSCLPDVQAVVRAESFYFDAHRSVFRAVCDLAAEGKPVDLVTVHDRLIRAKAAEDVGGAAYLADVWDAVPTAANVVYHAKIVRDLAAVRGVIHTAQEMLRDAFDRTAPADELVTSAERKLFDLSADGEADLIGAADLARDALQAIDDRAARKGPEGLQTGYAELDQVLSGLQGGQLVVIGARPGCGKTAFAMAVATNVAAAGTGVVFCSLEMSRTELMDRVLAIRSGVAMRTIRNGKMAGELADEVRAAADVFRSDPFYLMAATDCTVSKLAAVTRRSIRKHGVGLVVIDYLQLVTPENPRDQRHLQVGAMTRRLKQLAMTCNVPIVLLCQLNRESDNRQGGEPRLSDLRESGSIEQDADIVLLLHPHPDQPANAAVWNTSVIVAKNRNGPIAKVTLAYRRGLTRFENARCS